MLQPIKLFFEFVLWQYFIVAFFCALSYSILFINNINFFLPLFLIISTGLFLFNSINNVFDYNLDKISKPNRPLPSGRMSFFQAGLIIFLLLITNIIIAYIIFGFYGLFSLIYPLLSIFYSYKKISLRKLPFGDSLTGGILHVLIPILILYEFFNFYYLYLVFFFFVLYFFITLTKDIEDSKSDKIFGYNVIFSNVSKKNIFFLVGFVFLFMNFLSLLFAIYGIINYKLLIAAILSFFPILFIFFLFKLNIEKSNKIITQSKLVSYSMIIIGIIQVLYAFSIIM